MEYLQSILHYSNHFLIPVIFAKLFFKNNWKKVTLILWLTMLIDLDHLLATPIFEANRCSINFHPLHSYYLIPFYGVLCLFKKSKIVGIGLLWHLATDAIDCWMMK